MPATRTEEGIVRAEKTIELQVIRGASLEETAGKRIRAFCGRQTQLTSIAAPLVRSAPGPAARTISNQVQVAARVFLSATGRGPRRWSVAPRERLALLGSAARQY